MIQKELKKFREKLGKGKKANEEPKEVSKGLCVLGHSFDLDEFCDPDKDFCYDDQKPDTTSRYILFHIQATIEIFCFYTDEYKSLRIKHQTNFVRSVHIVHIFTYCNTAYSI